MEDFWCPEKSLFKLKILFYDGNQSTYYSRLKKDKQNEDDSRKFLAWKFLKSSKSFTGKFKSAIMINNKTGDVIEQYNSNGDTVIITNPILK